ncbi:MAG: hypothetical protein JWO80_92 [Bryobacterales bacterium]|nr:hypothetical protein [Bryobacterales bacterium]
MERRWINQLAGDIRGTWKLPPLILHPFAGDQGPDRLLEGSRAQLALQALTPDLDSNREDLIRLVVEGRHQELRMLFYIGKDLQRWAEQCMDFVAREPQLSKLGIREQSFVTLLVEHPPAGMAAKLNKWGVGDQRAIFSRAIGLNAVFDRPPELEFLRASFVQSYQRFADYLFIAYQTMSPYTALPPESFVFELYASEEYARMLAAGWG